MKKLLYSVSTALLLLSCNTEDPSLEAEPGKGGNMITFVGRTFPETRTEIGVKDGNSYPVLWSSGDRIGIISPVETLFQNASATLNASDAGQVPLGVVLAAARRGVRPVRDFEHGIRRLQTQRRVAVV